MQDHTKIGVFVNVPLAILGDGIKALVVSSMWGWFVVPLGLPAIGVAHAFGLIVLKSAAFQSYKYDPDERGPTAVNNQFVTMATRTAMVLFAWVLGACVHEVM